MSRGSLCESVGATLLRPSCYALPTSPLGLRRTSRASKDKSGFEGPVGLRSAAPTAVTRKPTATTDHAEGLCHFDGSVAVKGRLSREER